MGILKKPAIREIRKVTQSEAKGFRMLSEKPKGLSRPIWRKIQRGLLPCANTECNKWEKEHKLTNEGLCKKCFREKQAEEAKTNARIG